MEYRPLSESLPAPLPDGQQIRSFAKHCPACHARVEARHMRGLARGVDGQVFLAARAVCPQCQHAFNVSCTIAADKTVSRLWIPAGFMLWWLSSLKTPPMPVEQEPAAAEPVQEIHPEVSSEALGSFNGQPIPAWIDWQGRRYLFQRIDNGKPTQEHELRHAGLIFRRLEDKA